MNEEQNPTFSQALMEYISKALAIWPGLKVSLTHLSEAGSPPQGSPIPKKNYRDMTSEQFIKQIASDMHDYIMEHDIKSEHIEEYLDDILAILNSEEENIMTIRYMANQLASLIAELPEQKFERLYKFRQLYEDVQANAGSIVHQHQEDDSESDYEGEFDEEGYQCGEVHEQEDQNKISEEPPQLMSLEQQQELQDDGWVVVKKKNNKK